MDADLNIETLTSREYDVLVLMAEGLSNQQIAEKLYLTHGTVKWYASQIYSKLGVKSRTQAILKSQGLNLLQELSRNSDTSTASHSHIPIQLTSFIGREREIREIRQLLEEHRLVTLSGFGGSGKTRLAIEVAQQIQESYTDGAHFVSLAPLTEATHVMSAIAETLEIKEKSESSITEALLDYLRHKHLLLVLDNFEHVLDATALLLKILQSAARAKILVTSREVLRIYGEQEYLVRPLELPDLQDMGSLEKLQNNEALKLFVQRARAVQPVFDLTPENAAVVIEISRRLDGLPLALELAAARVRLFTPQQLLQRLAHSLNVLVSDIRDAPARQQTLQGAIAWSYDLLNADEKHLFVSLAIFRGGCNLDALEAICTNGLQTDGLVLVESLLNKNLIQISEGQTSEPRITMLETVSEYARTQLDKSGVFKDLANRHAAYFTQMVEGLEADMRGNHEERAVERIETDKGNIRTALSWSFGGGNIQHGLRLLAVMGYFWIITSRYVECDNWFFIGMAKRREAAPVLRVRLLLAGTFIGYSLNRQEEAIAYLNEALEIAREEGDKNLIAQSLMMLSIFCVGVPAEYDRGMAMMQEALTLFREGGNSASIGEALNVFGELERAMGHYEAAKVYYEESLTNILESGVERRIMMTYQNLGSVALNQGDYKSAEKYLRQSIVDLTNYDRFAVLSGLSALAATFAAQKHFDKATHIIGAVEAQLDLMGTPLQPPEIQQHEKAIAIIKSHFDEDHYQTLWAEGSKMTLSEAIDYALADDQA